MNSSVRRPAAGRARQTSRRARAKVLAEFRCQSILAAAEAVFARHGFAATTVDLIAEAAGVAKGTLYLYYPSKSALYSAAVTAGFRDLAQQTIASLSADAPLPTKLRNLFEMRLRYFQERADFFRIYTAELGSLGQAAVEIRQEHRRLFHQQVNSLEREVRAAMRGGVLRKLNPRQVAVTVLDLSHGIVQRTLDPVPGDDAEDVDALLNILWKGIAK